MSQTQTNKPKTEAAAWKPDKYTIFLVQSFDPEFERIARNRIEQLYLRDVGYRIETQIDPRKLHDRHTVVGVYQDPTAGIADPVTGEERPRRAAVKRDGVLVAPAERPEPKLTVPISCADFYSEVDHEGAVAVRNWVDVATGRTHKGLMALLTDAMKTKRGGIVARVQYNDRNNSPDTYLTIVPA